MEDFDEIRDPIVRIYATELEESLQSVAARATAVLYDAKKSLQNNRRVPQEENATAYQSYFKVEKAYRGLYVPIPTDLKHSLDEMTSVFSVLIEATDYFRLSRRYFQRYTTIDISVSGLRNDISEVGQNIDLLKRAALENEEPAKKLIYERILGEKLDQLDAPYLFEIINFVVDLTSPPPNDVSANANEGLALLAKEAHDLAGSLIRTNVDRRFLSAINEYIGALTEPNFSPIKVDLFSNRLRFYLIEMKDELPGFAIAEVSALLLSQERVLRQFPLWRTFESDASQFQIDQDTAKNQQTLLERIAFETKRSTGIASEGVLDAFDRLVESSTESKKTATLGIWRSVENFLKINIRYVIGVAKALQTNVTANQIRYVKYLERLIPALKLYVSMDPSRAWLLPVIQWLEDTLKTIKK